MHTLSHAAPPQSFWWTPSYVRRLRARAETEPGELIGRHQRGDWGCCTALQARLNGRAVREGGVVVSVFPRPEEGFSSPTFVFTDSATRCTTVADRAHLLEAPLFTLGRLRVSAAARTVLIDASGNARSSEDDRARNETALRTGSEGRAHTLRLLLLRHGLGDGGDLPEPVRRHRPANLWEAVCVRTEFQLGTGGALEIYTDRERGHTAVISSEEGPSGPAVIDAICRREGRVSQRRLRGGA